MVEEKYKEGIIVQGVDPTTNVIKLVEGAVARLDDLRSTDRMHDSELHKAESRRLDDLRFAESRRIDEQALIRQGHTKEINEKESSRLDSIRQVDMANASITAASLALAIQTLNSTSITNADNLRNSLTSTAAAMARSTADLATTIATQQSIRDENINKRLTSLEQVSYVGQGKEKITDPIMDKLIEKMDNVVAKLSTSKGHSEGAVSMGDWIIRGGLFLIALAGVTVAILK